MGQGALPDLSIRQLEYLVAITESPTWAVAADSVGVSPSALSQGLAELERRLGLTLFERQGRRRVLRPEAAVVLAHARQVVSLTSDLTRWANRVREGYEGAVRVGMIDAAAVVHFPELLRDFRARRADLELRLSVGPSGALFADLVAGRLDLAVGVDPPEPLPGLDLEPLLVEDLVVFAPPGLEIGDPSGWGPWVLFPEGSHTRLTIEAGLTALGVTVELTAESHQPEVLQAMVELGLGWTVLPVSQTRTEDPGAGPVIGHRQLVVAVRSGSPLAPAVEALLADLVEGRPEPPSQY
ncbi:MAG: LysR family transcriptional regulator [Actinomycetia bacterium]|nr:LysR family transcriptional regulator [Actinomycetes bacterium]MCP3913747.1 LysR family transcriptional regulator [Actinomycetes bacterium]MCP4086216.1 LysR family transcriptional regulator [Actinomycetes bacterium]